jgi:hypothetical protein
MRLLSKRDGGADAVFNSVRSKIWKKYVNKTGRRNDDANGQESVIGNSNVCILLDRVSQTIDCASVWNPMRSCEASTEIRDRSKNSAVMLAVIVSECPVRKRSLH